MRGQTKVLSAFAVLAAFLILGVALASATAPTVSVDNATSVSYTSAHVSGEVDPQGQATTYRFQYTPQAQFEAEAFENSATGPEATIEGPAEPVAGELNGLTPNTTYHLRLFAENGDGPSEAVASSTFTTLAVAAPTVTIDAPSAITGGSAHFSGTINPGAPAANPAAFDVSWSFQCDPACPELTVTEGTNPVSADSTGHEVAVDATGLKPGTAYEVTLLATNAGGQVSAGPEAFSTPTTAPQIKSISAHVSSTEATLEAQVNPGGLATTYRFDYGPSADYGLSTATKTLAAGTAPAMVSANLLGLTPQSGYHYRLIASNSVGTSEGVDQTFTTGQSGTAADTCPNAAVRAQQHSQYLPDCRAYELVSPADKKGGTVAFGTLTGQIGVTGASRNGERVAYSSWTTLVDGEGGMPLTYRAERSPIGWSSEAVSPKPTNPYASAVEEFSGWEVMTPDLSFGYSDFTRDTFEPTDTNEHKDVYRTGPHQETELLSRGNGAERQGLYGINKAVQEYGGVADDGSSVIFNSPEHLVPDRDADRYAALSSLGTPAISDAYDRSNEHTYLLNQTNSGEMINRCGSIIGSNYMRSVHLQNSPGAISSNGSKVFFTVPFSRGEFSAGSDCNKPEQIYMRVNNSRTVHISASQRTVPDPAGTLPATFVDATPDGSKVFFTSPELLTNDATPGGGLYRYNTDTGNLTLLLDELATAPGEFRISADGSTIYFLSYYELTDEVTKGITLYVWSNGTIRRIADDDETYIFTRQGGFVSRLTPDGDRMLFSTSAPLTSFANSGQSEVYIYDVGTGELKCISCDPAGQRPVRGVVRSGASIAGEEGRDSPISADGQTAVFQSGDRLVPGDINDHVDVYQYRDGRLSLISSGHGEADSLLVGMGATGINVFIATFDRLGDSDSDGGDLDIYDARIDGGFLEAERAAPVPACQGEGCQGALGGRLAAATPGSAVFTRPGSSSRRKSCPKSKSHGNRAARSHVRRCRRLKTKGKPAHGRAGSRKTAALSHDGRKGR